MIQLSQPTPNWSLEMALKLYFSNIYLSICWLTSGYWNDYRQCGKINSKLEIETLFLINENFAPFLGLFTHVIYLYPPTFYLEPPSIYIDPLTFYIDPPIFVIIAQIYLGVAPIYLGFAPIYLGVAPIYLDIAPIYLTRSFL